MHAMAEAAPTMKTTVVKKPGLRKLRELTVEPADNGYTVHTRHHNDYDHPNGPPKGKVFEKKNGHEMLKHVARKLGIKAKIGAATEAESAAEDAGEGDED